MKLNKGQGLIEVLVAISVFVIGVVTISILMIDASFASRQGNERTQAVLLAREGLEVARALRDEDFDNLTNGSHGIALSSGQWIFSGTSDTQDQFTRVVEVSNVGDGDNKRIDSTVAWDFSEGREGEVTLTSYLSNWTQTRGNAGDVVINVDDATFVAGDKRVEGITLQNIGLSDVTLDSVIVSWDNSNLIDLFRIENTTLWSWNAIGTPTGMQPSGTELDLEDYVLPADSSVHEITIISFDNVMTDALISIKFIFSDGSSRYVVVEAGASPTCSPEIDFLEIGIDNAILAVGDRELQGITLYNSDSECLLSVDTITPTWTNSNLIENIRIDGNAVWNNVGVGTPSGSQSSGVELDIIDQIILPLSTSTIDRFRFDSSMTGANFSIKFTMVDGSNDTVNINFATDVTAPDAVNDLALSNQTAGSIDLAWTAPGDDGAVGTATSYDVRYSTSTITELNWASVNQAVGEPTPSASGSNESMTVSGLDASTLYYFAIKTSDEVPNISAISNVPSLSTLANPQSASLVIDTSGASIGGSNNKEILGITTQNTGLVNITIDKMTLTWTNGKLIQDITIEGGGVWVFNGVGTPDGRQPTGTELDIVDYILVAGNTDNIDAVEFNGSMLGDTFNITFEMGDGSTKSTGSFSP
ncbi:fibronectin type III domain-containing protein [Patescibacteria group bacterium]